MAYVFLDAPNVFRSVQKCFRAHAVISMTEFCLFLMQYRLTARRSQPSNSGFWPCPLCTEITSNYFNYIMYHGKSINTISGEDFKKKIVALFAQAVFYFYCLLMLLFFLPNHVMVCCQLTKLVNLSVYLFSSITQYFKSFIFEVWCRDQIQNEQKNSIITFLFHVFALLTIKYGFTCFANHRHLLSFRFCSASQLFFQTGLEMGLC